ncbi:MAG: GNAT family N-acetyltransferase [Selenomonadaceae bacterium]|nr:GNAT family N-acetyltransferase [Selenomonadaceae bacterium]
MLLKKIENKLKFLDLLLLADENFEMIKRYIDKGTMYIFEENEIIGECVVLEKNSEILEIKNLAVYPNFQNQGYGKKIIDAICKKYLRKYKILELGTGDSPLTIPFYLKCGFKYAGRIEKFFIKNYECEIYECGVKLVDMIILQKNFAD